MAEPKFDVAISFLSADEPLAAALYNALSEGTEVFFYPRKQEDLAGTNGLESMRTPFLEESRVVVVLYRESWGNTPWTRVEQTAIQDSCLRHGWQRLFFMMLDNTSSPPKWLPDAHVRFNYADFGLEQAIGAIKARVQERGGAMVPLTALKRAELSRNESQYLQEKRELCSRYDIVKQKALELFSAIEGICTDVNAGGDVSIEFQSEPTQCHLRSRVSLIVNLRNRMGEFGSESQIAVRAFDKGLRMGREQQFVYPDGEPRQLSESTYMPDINHAREFGWTEVRRDVSFR